MRALLAIIGLAVAYVMIRNSPDWHDLSGLSQGPVSLRETFGFQRKTDRMSFDEFIASLTDGS
jgi:hypothetical protein